MMTWSNALQPVGVGSSAFAGYVTGPPLLSSYIVVADCICRFVANSSQPSA
jgi:hypothetical protein